MRLTDNDYFNLLNGKGVQGQLPNLRPEWEAKDSSALAAGFVAPTQNLTMGQQLKLDNLKNALEPNLYGQNPFAGQQANRDDDLREIVKGGPTGGAAPMIGLNTPAYETGNAYIQAPTIGETLNPTDKVSNWVDKQVQAASQKVSETAAKNAANKAKTPVKNVQPQQVVAPTATTGALAFYKNVTSPFGMRTAPTKGASTNHQGIDIGAREGEPIPFYMDGTVVGTGSDKANGNFIRIKDADGNVHTVAHMKFMSPLKTGTKVGRGTIIGNVGSTGISTGPHAHVGVKNAKGQAINPAQFLEGNYIAMDNMNNIQRPDLIDPVTGQQFRMQNAQNVLPVIQQPYINAERNVANIMGMQQQAAQEYDKATRGIAPQLQAGIQQAQADRAANQFNKAEIVKALEDGRITLDQARQFGLDVAQMYADKITPEQYQDLLGRIDRDSQELRAQQEANMIANNPRFQEAYQPYDLDAMNKMKNFNRRLAAMAGQDTFAYEAQAQDALQRAALANEAQAPLDIYREDTKQMNANLYNNYTQALTARQNAYKEYLDAVGKGNEEGMKMATEYIKQTNDYLDKVLTAMYNTNVNTNVASGQDINAQRDLAQLQENIARNRATVETGLNPTATQTLGSLAASEGSALGGITGHVVDPSGLLTNYNTLNTGMFNNELNNNAKLYTEWLKQGSTTGKPDMTIGNLRSDIVDTFARSSMRNASLETQLDEVEILMNSNPNALPHIKNRIQELNAGGVYDDLLRAIEQRWGV